VSPPQPSTTTPEATSQAKRGAQLIPRHGSVPERDLVEREPIARRVFSLSGVVPLGFFLVLHVWASASALRGQDAYVARVESLGRVPLAGVLEVAFVLLPLAFHAVYGVWFMRQPVVPRPEPLASRALAITDRVAAGLALVFIVWHFVEYRWPVLRGTTSARESYTLLVWRLSSTWHGFPARAMFMLLGALATVFHFVVGMFCWCVRTGLLVTRTQKVRAAWVFLSGGAVLFLVATSTVVSLATGMELASPPPSVPCEPKADR
jgi:succinate dehydrogenase / fumarate reductase cytochrome b subunit